MLYDNTCSVRHDPRRLRSGCLVRRMPRSSDGAPWGRAPARREGRAPPGPGTAGSRGTPAPRYRSHHTRTPTKQILD